MKPRDVIHAQIHHQETPVVPYTLPFEDEVGSRLDAHYGGAGWRDRLVPYMVTVQAVDTDIKEDIDGVHVRDAYGGIWRTDRRPWHLETPPLAEPSFEGYGFPAPEVFYRPAWKEKAFRTCAEHPDAFRVGGLGWGLFERSWNLRGFENVLMDAVSEPEFYADLWQTLLAGAGSLLHRRLPDRLLMALSLAGNLVVVGLAIRLLAG